MQQHSHITNIPDLNDKHRFYFFKYYDYLLHLQVEKYWNKIPGEVI